MAGICGLGINFVWVADPFWRFVDRPCVESARWLDGKCVDENVDCA